MSEEKGRSPTGFRKYQHIERWGNDEVEGIEIGNCYVFYKIDGTNSSVWLRDGELKAGSRNRTLSLDNDNGGFLEAISKDQRIIDYLNKHPDHTLYGEWLIPHTLKNYREDAWRHFYVFDVVKNINDTDYIYLSYDAYKPLLEEFSIDYIPPICIIKNPNSEQIFELLDKTGNFLIKDGSGFGEGIVIKNYDYQNKYGRTTWAKIVRSEFKEQNAKVFGAPLLNGGKSVEEMIVDKFYTEAEIEKTFSKMTIERPWTSSMIPELFNRCYSEVIKEEIWHMLKEFNFPKIDFRLLKALTINKIKKVKYLLF